MTPEPELTDKHGRPPRPRPGAAEADALRGQQIARLEQENRALAARVAQMERVLGPAFAPRRPAAPGVPLPPAQSTTLFSGDPRHDLRFVATAVRGGDVRAALRQIAEDTAVPRLMAQKAEYALSFIAKGMAVPDALDQAEEAVCRGPAARQPRPVPTLPLVPFPARDEDGNPVQRSVVRREWEDFPDHQPAGRA